jgi:hypothetical protein
MIRPAKLSLSTVLVGAVVTLAVLMPAAARADDCQSVDVQTNSNACAGVLAVSATGDARGNGTCTSEVSCVAMSGTGNASNSSGCGNSRVACVAASGTGNATYNSAGCGGGQLFFGVGCVAASGTGNATNDGGQFCGVVSGPILVGAGCVAVSGTGSATNSSYGCGEGCVAASGTGSATNNSAYGCGSGVGLRCVAASGTGPADNRQPDGSPCPQYASQSGIGCVAVSGTGHTTNSAKYCDLGCETLIFLHTIARGTAALFHLVS